MRESGLSTLDIAEEVGVHRTSVYCWLKRWDEEGNLRDHPKSGRRRKTTAEEDRRIRNYFETHPFSNAVAAVEHLQLDLSAETIRMRMKEMGFHHRIPAIKPKLTERHRELRLQFAQRYVHQDLDFWGRVIFYDEKTFSSTSHGKLHCWRRDNTR